jgi:hypothetical protein
MKIFNFFVQLLFAFVMVQVVLAGDGAIEDVNEEKIEDLDGEEWKFPDADNLID